MSYEYDQYLREHRENVAKGFDWLEYHLPFITMSHEFLRWQICEEHDTSKNDPLEYHAYDAYFYGRNKSHTVVENFNRAWLHHIHCNPHHWQYWVLINDDPKEGEVILDMDYNYIIEMICDWWAFSWKKGNLYEIFSWYREHRDYMKLSAKTRNTVERLLEQMQEKLDELEFKED